MYHLLVHVETTVRLLIKFSTNKIVPLSPQAIKFKFGCLGYVSEPKL